MNNDNNKTLGCYVDINLYNKVSGLANVYGTTTSKLIKEIIRKYISNVGTPHEDYIFSNL